MTPIVVDMFSGEEMDSSKTGTLADFKKVYASGIRGIIHKSTQGANYRDKECLRRRDLAREAGLLWGYYHFGTSADVETQAANFLKVVGDDTGALLALDFEKNEPNPSDTMNFAQAKEFLRLVYEKTGQRPVLYSGHWLKEKLPKGGDPFISKHRLWLAQYSQTATMPAGFSKFWLHQFTGDGTGPEPHNVPGIKTRGIDLNEYGGVDLASEWAPTSEALVTSVLGGAEAGVSASQTAPNPSLVAATASTVKSAYQSRSICAALAGVLSTIFGVLTDWAKEGWDWVMWAVGLAPDLYSDTKEALSSAEEVASWFRINFSAISMIFAGICVAIFIIRHLMLRQQVQAQETTQ